MLIILNKSTSLSIYLPIYLYIYTILPLPLESPTLSTNVPKGEKQTIIRHLQG
jgi:hypothetical protein